MVVTQWTSDVPQMFNGCLYEVWTSYRHTLDVQRTFDPHWEIGTILSHTSCKLSILAVKSSAFLAFSHSFCNKISFWNPHISAIIWERSLPLKPNQRSFSASLFSIYYVVSIINHKNIFDKYIYNDDNCYNEIFFKFCVISKFLEVLIYTKNYNRKSRMFHGKL